MRPVSQLKLFIAHAAVGILALAGPTTATTLFLNVDTTLATNNTGTDGANGGPNANGIDADPSVVWASANVDVLSNSGLTFTGGNGGHGGPDFANSGSNIGGGNGGHGFYLALPNGTVTGSGIFVFGGAGGDGSNGGIGGASDANGGGGGDGGMGITAMFDAFQISLSNSTVNGGAGGSGGDAGDIAGDPANNAWGENGGDGGHGILSLNADGATITLNSTTVTGGNGGNAGVSLPPTTNANGGAGGNGIFYFGANIIIDIGVGSIVQGGDGGAMGTGGTGGGAGVDGAGVVLFGFNATVTNHGMILGSDTGVTGAESAIYVFEDTTIIDNHGMIGVGSDHAASGIFVDGGATLGTLHNQAGGQILSSGSAHTIIILDGGISALLNEGVIANSGSGDALSVVGSISNFTNSGAIQAVTGSALVFSGANTDFPALIDNTSGVIENDSGTAPTINIATNAIPSGVSLKGGLVNNDGGSLAVALQIAAQISDVTITDATITSDGQSVKFDGAGQSLFLVNTTVGGDVMFTGAGNTLTFDIGGTTTLLPETQLNNATAVTLLAGSNVISNAEQTDLNSSIGTLLTAPGSTLTLNENFLTDGAVQNEGTVILAAGKAVKSTGSFSSNGKVVFGVADDGTAGQIHSQGGIDLTGSTLEIVLVNPASTFVSGTNILLGSDFDPGAVDGITNGTQLADNSALMEFYLYSGDAPEIGGNAYQFFAQVQAALLADIAGEGDDPNSIALGAALDEIGLNGDADLDDLMLDLALLSTNKEINDVLDTLLPETDGVAYDLATDADDQMLDVASRRLDGLRGSASAGLEYRVASLGLLGLRGTAAPAARSQLWGQAFGRTVDQSKHGYNDGYDAGSYGFAVGADTALDNATQLGAAFSYTSTDADGNGINRTDTDVESYQLMLYGDHLFENRMYAKGLLAYGWHANDIARHDVGGIPGNTATGSYDADHITARAELGRAYKGGDNLTLIPRAHLNAAWYSPDSYAEQGVGGLGLTVAPDDLTSVRLGLGVLARWDIALSGDELFRPELRLDYRRDVTQERFETTSEFLGAPGIVFRTQGVEPAPDILNLGVGALLATAGGVDLRASYDLELKEDYTAHAGHIRASVAF